MKRFRKALLALAALLGVLIVGGIWLVNSALNVASDVVDSTLNGAQKVEAIAQKEVIGAAQNAPTAIKTAPFSAEHSADAPDNAAPTLTAKASDAQAADKTADQPADRATRRETSSAAKPSADKNQADETNTMDEFSSLFSVFFDDSEDASDVTALLKSGDREAKAEDKETTSDKPAKEGDDALVDMIPGANSPTVKGWMAGKYKGKESQALDDALEDPKLLRLVFMLFGGM